MSEESELGQERTEQPTPKRRREAREKGQVPRSRELTTCAVMLAGTGTLMLAGGYMVHGLTGLMRSAFHLSRATLFDPRAAVRVLEHGVGAGLLVVAPLALAALLAALLSPLLIGGWTFSPQALAPKLDKLDPVAGLKRIFGLRGAVELVKALAKVLVVGMVAWMLLWGGRDDFRALGAEPLGRGLAHAASLLGRTFLTLSAALLLVAAIDVPWQIWEYGRRLRMTRQEVKDEMKETDGKPEVKGRIRRLQRRIAQGRMLERLPAADVVVTNPQHFAVALEYDQKTARAPRVVAKGTDLVAARIREIAHEHGVPLFEAPPLARALYHTTEIDQEIPAGLYHAVALVLAYIYQLRAMRRRGGPRPRRPEPKVPDEYLRFAGPYAGAGGH